MISDRLVNMDANNAGFNVREWDVKQEHTRMGRRVSPVRIMMLNQSPRDLNDPDDHEYHERVQTILNTYVSPGTQIDVCYPDDHPGAGITETMSRQGARSEL